MESIKIKISRLGAIRDSELEVTPIMLFSGESGLGKSYLAILIHYLFEVLLSEARLSLFFKQEGIDYNELVPNFKNQGEAVRFTKQSLEEWMNTDVIFYLREMLGYRQLDGLVQITLPSVIPDDIIITYREDLLGLGGEEGVYLLLASGHLQYRVPSGTISVDEEVPFATLLRYVLRSYIFGDYRSLMNSVVLPPARALALTEKMIPSTGMYQRFDSWLSGTILPPSPNRGEPSLELQKLIPLLLGGDVSRKDGRYVYNVVGAEIPLSAAAASVRELAPLQLLFNTTNVGTTSILFEEPEAHLHAEKQRLIADVISLINKEGGYMQITTHSDYFLGRINELIKLQCVYEKLERDGRVDEYNSICSDLDISPELRFQYKGRLSSYYLERREDGSTRVVRDEDVENGITFKSFRRAVQERIDLEMQFDEFLNN